MKWDLAATPKARKMRGRLTAGAASALLSVTLLTGCDPASNAVLTGASVVSLMQSKKTLTDQALSWALDEDCSTLFMLRGEEYCQPRALVDERERYCYRTLGSITCYAKPDPRSGPMTLVQ